MASGLHELLIKHPRRMSSNLNVHEKYYYVWFHHHHHHHHQQQQIQMEVYFKPGLSPHQLASSMFYEVVSEMLPLVMLMLLLWLHVATSATFGLADIPVVDVAPRVGRRSNNRKQQRLRRATCRKSREPNQTLPDL
ncbi:hypothetical protein M0802_004947 [Mischocyttarus mexicanus]|nr:hypothetical protein M0802_004947 [Mischocyttarus mexicanus]